MRFVLCNLVFSNCKRNIKLMSTEVLDRHLARGGTRVELFEELSLKNLEGDGITQLGNEPPL